MQFHSGCTATNKKLFATAQHQPLECQLLSVGCGTLIFSRYARRTPPDIFLKRVVIISQKIKRDPTIRSQECSHFFTGKGLSLVALLQQMADISVSFAFVWWIGLIRFMTPMVLQKRTGGFISGFSTALPSKEARWEVVQGKVSPPLQMKLQLSSPSENTALPCTHCTGTDF